MARLYILRRNHFHHRLLVIVCLLVAWRCTLEQTVIALGVEQPLLVEACLLELVVDIGGDDEIILVFHDFKQSVINGFWSRQVSVALDMAAPISPMLLFARKLVEACRVHIRKTIFINEIGKVFTEPFARIGEPRRGGQSGPRANHDGIGGLYCLIKFLCFHKTKTSRIELAK